MSLFYYLQNDLTFASKNIDGHIFAVTSQEQIDGTSAYRKTGQFYFLDIIRKDWVPKDHFPFVSADLKPKTSLENQKATFSIGLPPSPGEICFGKPRISQGCGRHF